MAIQDETITEVVLSMFKIIDNVAPVKKKEKNQLNLMKILFLVPVDRVS